MNAKDVLKDTLNLSNMVLSAYVGDLTDAELMKRPGPGCNHIAWQLGHLIGSECGLLNMIREGSAPELPAGFKEQHGKETVGSDDPAKFGTKQQYLDLTGKVHAATVALLDAYPEADFALPAPEALRAICPTMGSMFVLIATHPMMHAGQVVPVRRALGKPVVI
ncbi:MAG: DinB family protein [Planctomycetaceae bacterium]|nr:DinB family protein [Planctomycetaceae bacterium]